MNLLTSFRPQIFWIPFAIWIVGLAMAELVEPIAQASNRFAHQPRNMRILDRSRNQQLVITEIKLPGIEEQNKEILPQTNADLPTISDTTQPAGETVPNLASVIDRLTRRRGVQIMNEMVTGYREIGALERSKRALKDNDPVEAKKIDLALVEASAKVDKLMKENANAIYVTADPALRIALILKLKPNLVTNHLSKHDLTLLSYPQFQSIVKSQTMPGEKQFLDAFKRFRKRHKVIMSLVKRQLIGTKLTLAQAKSIDHFFSELPVRLKGLVLSSNFDLAAGITMKKLITRNLLDLTREMQAEWFAIFGFFR